MKIVKEMTDIQLLSEAMKYNNPVIVAEIQRRQKEIKKNKFKLIK